MDEFSFFFTFYGLLLGLAAAEVLGELGAFARSRPLRTLDPVAGLFALLVFLVICATWLDAWTSRADFRLDFASLWAPIGIATAYYLAATVVLPRDEAQFGRLSEYIGERKSFVVGAMVVAEILVKITLIPHFERQLAIRPAVFWLWSVPFNVLIFGSWAWLWAARSRRGTMAATLALIAIYSIPYWENGALTAAVARAWGYS